MKISAKKLAAALMAGSIALTAVGCGPTEQKPAPKPDLNSWNVTSPDGTIDVRIGMDSAGALYYTVQKGDVAVVDQSTLGFAVAEDDLSFLTFEGEKTERVTGSYDNVTGKRSHVEYDCNQTTLTFKAWQFYLDVVMRAYDDGYAFRYAIRGVDGGEGTLTVEEEKTEFALPENSVVWSQPYVTNKATGKFFSYEEAYVRRKASNLAGKIISMPMLYQAGESEVYSLITESELIGSGFYGSFLEESEEKEGTGILQTVRTPATALETDNVVSYPFESPWRVGITGDMKTVIESELVEKVYDDAEYWKPDDYDSLTAEEQATYDYSWVEPGVTAWNWLRYTGSVGQNDWDLQISYVDLAAEMGWKYTILDGGWSAGSTFNTAGLTKFCEYAAQKGVKVLVWCDALVDFSNGVESLLCSKLDQWKSCGVAGIKIDFFDGQNANAPKFQGEDIDMIKWYETIYQETARRQMIVNCHGANKPTGERRIYPNVINREAIRGNEMRNIDSSVTVNSMFTRGVLGSCDFTPVVTPRSSGMTMGQQMALAVLYESGTPSMADYADTYRDELINNFYKSVPAARDETVYLCGLPDEYYCAAVRVGDEWFVAGINGILESQATIDFSFLGEGSYTAEFFTDAEGAKTVEKQTKTITSATKETVSMAKNGGFVYHLTKV
ncbi:MAG TPA: glycoside hydrolase family 97 protein [Candidatus Borkfalkia faecipullorum]|uniref:Glycoside hydrolase family 97 protein n=1 Tax=Candidatus Borkfalkia faecipullorum TaxID=2838510 RepID=A0A9D1V6M7_9FIRM|nr:glycoside hydrolase family 97 protein [Candidatus Borkfalkia faecipullorum]